MFDSDAPLGDGTRGIEPSRASTASPRVSSAVSSFALF
jgi:hypothetical protein